MIRHAISLGARTYNWPSQQAGSEEVRKRIARANRARIARRQVEPFLKRFAA